METYIIRLFEGSYMYSEIEVLGPLPSHLLFSGILEELNHQYNYRPTQEDLRATVHMDEAELYRVTRLTEGLAKVREASKFDQPYKFMPLESYSFVRVVEIIEERVGN